MKKLIKNIKYYIQEEKEKTHDLRKKYIYMKRNLSVYRL